jgi:hypothetical protein
MREECETVGKLVNGARRTGVTFNARLVGGRGNSTRTARGGAFKASKRWL